MALCKHSEGRLLSVTHHWWMCWLKCLGESFFLCCVENVEMAQSLMHGIINLKVNQTVAICRLYSYLLCSASLHKLVELIVTCCGWETPKHKGFMGNDACMCWMFHKKEKPVMVKLHCKFSLKKCECHSLSLLNAKTRQTNKYIN